MAIKFGDRKFKDGLPITAQDLNDTFGVVEKNIETNNQQHLLIKHLFDLHGESMPPIETVYLDDSDKSMETVTGLNSVDFSDFPDYSSTHSYYVTDNNFYVCWENTSGKLNVTRIDLSTHSVTHVIQDKNKIGNSKNYLFALSDGKYLFVGFDVDGTNRKIDLLIEVRNNDDTVHKSITENLRTEPSGDGVGLTPMSWCAFGNNTAYIAFNHYDPVDDYNRAGIKKINWDLTNINTDYTYQDSSSDTDYRTDATQFSGKLFYAVGQGPASSSQKPDIYLFIADPSSGNVSKQAFARGNVYPVRDDFRTVTIGKYWVIYCAGIQTVSGDDPLGWNMVWVNMENDSTIQKGIDDYARQSAVISSCVGENYMYFVAPTNTSSAGTIYELGDTDWTTVRSNVSSNDYIQTCDDFWLGDSWRGYFSGSKLYWYNYTNVETIMYPYTMSETGSAVLISAPFSPTQLQEFDGEIVYDLQTSEGSYSDNEIAKTLSLESEEEIQSVTFKVTVDKERVCKINHMVMSIG